LDNVTEDAVRIEVVVVVVIVVVVVLVVVGNQEKRYIYHMRIVHCP
jgi:hypothetical protein